MKSKFKLVLFALLFSLTAFASYDMCCDMEDAMAEADANGDDIGWINIFIDYIENC